MARPFYLSPAQNRAASPAVDALRDLAHRVALAGGTKPQGVKGPPLRYLLRELDFVSEGYPGRLEDEEVELAAEPKLVMLLPGFGTHPIRMRHMAQQLERAGHTVKRWGLGFNLGPTPENFELLSRRVEELHRRYGKKVHLVGWSLGGVFAREIAKLHPDHVAKVMTLGSPFSGDPHANNVWRLYQVVAGHLVTDPPVGKNRSEKPPVPTVAFWSPRDGMVHARAACGRPGERDRAVSLRCSHIGFCYSRESIHAVLTELDRED